MFNKRRKTVHGAPEGGQANPLYSTSGNPDRMKSWTARFFLIGATFMGFGPMHGLMQTRGNVAAAQDAASVRAVLDMIKKPAEDTRKLFAEQRKLQANKKEEEKVVVLPISDGVRVNAWVEAWAKTNAAMGRQVYDLQGADEKAKFQSANRQINLRIGRDANHVFDNRSLEEVEKMQQEAANAKAAGPAATMITPPVQAPPAPSTTSGAGPVRGGAVPARTGPAPSEAQGAAPTPSTRTNAPSTTAEGLDEVQNSAYLVTIARLKTLGSAASDLGAAATVAQRTEATAIRLEMERILKKTKPTKDEIKKLATLNTKAQTLIDSVSSKAVHRQANVPVGANVSIDSEVAALKTSLVSTSGPIADQIREYADDTAFCGEQAAKNMLRDLKLARDALLRGDNTTAQAEADSAKATRQAEQASIRRFAQAAIDFNRGNATAVRSAQPPLASMNDLTQAEITDGVPATLKDARKKDKRISPEQVERDRYYKTSDNRKTVHNTSGDMAAEWDSRAENIEKYMQGRGKVSYHFVASQFFPIRSEARSVQLLADGYKYAKEHGLDTLPATDGRRAKFWRAYSMFAMAMSDPNYNVYDSLPQHLKDSLISDERKLHTGTRISDTELQKIVRNKLRQQYSYKLAIVTQNFVETVSAFSTKPTGDMATNCDRWAGLRTQRAICEADYQVYLQRLKEGVDEDNKPTYVNLVDADQKERLEKIYGILKDAIMASGLNSQDKLIAAANRWIAYVDANKATLTPNHMATVSDTLYHMTVGILAISEAELWINTPSMRPSSVPQNSPRVANARTTVADARRLFELSFEDPSFKPINYPLLPRSIADLAINMMAPPSHKVTDDLAYFTQMREYNAIKDDDPAGAKELALNAAKRYFVMIMDTKDNPNFGVPAVLRNGGAYAGWDYPMSVASFQLGRSSYEFIQQYKGHRRPTDSRTDENRTFNSDQTNAALTPRGAVLDWHEPLERAHMGYLWLEQESMTRSFVDADTPAILRDPRFNPYSNFDLPVNSTTLQIGTQTPQDAAITANTTSTGIVGTWVRWGHLQVQELMTKFNCASEDELEKRLQLALPRNPAAKYGLRAIWMLRMADVYHGQFDRNAGVSFYDGSAARTNPRQTRMLIQAAMVDATNPDLLAINELPKLPVAATGPNVRFDPTIEQTVESGFLRARTTSLNTTIGNTRMSAAQYLRTYPNMELVYNWGWVVKTHSHIFMRNPSYNPNDQNSMKYAAELFPSGNGFMAVRIHRLGDGSPGVVLDGAGRILASDLLFYTDNEMKPRMTTDAEVALVNRNKRLVFFASDLDTDVIPRPHGTVNAVMFAIPRQKTASAASASAAPTSAPVTSTTSAPATSASSTTSATKK